MFFLPFSLIIFILFLFFIPFLFILIKINLISFAFIKIGIPPQYVMATLLFTLIGSFINIPVAKIPQDIMVEERRINFFGFIYYVPVSKKKMTVLAVNVGGALIPVFVSIYLLLKTGLYFKAFLSALIITIICLRMAKPVRGIGIAIPFFIPPSLATILSTLIAFDSAPVIAYISGTLGTLIGADLLNLRKIGRLGAPVASIGGAGTFDGIFLTGILAVIFSTIFTL